MNYLEKMCFGDYRNTVVALESGTTVNRLSTLVVKNVKFLLRTFVHMKLPTALILEDMNDNSVRLEWWNKTKKCAVFVDVFEKDVILTNMKGAKVTKEISYSISDQKLVHYVQTDVNSVYNEL